MKLPRLVTKGLARKLIWSPRAAAADRFVSGAPSPQQTLDIFRGEWASRLPAPLSGTKAGEVPLFEDPRIEWAATALGGVEGKAVLELGPLEGGHTYMLSRLGAESVTAVEGNTRAFLKCLVAKELLELNDVRFLYGDIVEYLRGTPKRFDVCVASGVLYHLRNPIELIALTAKKANGLFVWTHYFDADRVARDTRLRRRIASSARHDYGGFEHTLHRYKYGLSVRWAGFCGGGSSFSHWLSRSDILAALEHFGWTNVEIAFDEPDHPNGPAFAFVASQKRA